MQAIKHINHFGHGLSALTPDEKDSALVSRAIFDELCLGEIRDNSRAEFLRIIDGLATSLPPSQVFPPLSHLIRNYFASPEAASRRGAMLALGVAVEGCSEYMTVAGTGEQELPSP